MWNTVVSPQSCYHQSAYKAYSIKIQGSYIFVTELLIFLTPNEEILAALSRTGGHHTVDL